MKPYYPFSAVFCLAAVQGTLALGRPSPGLKSAPSNTPSLFTPSQIGGVNLSIPVCGAGFTYCGYILRDHKNFQETDIIKAYCAAHKDNCVNGTTKTDPIQALYICVPPNVNPIEARVGSSSRVGGSVTKPPSSNLSENGKEKKQKPETHNRLSPQNHRHAHRLQADEDTGPKSKRFHHHIPNPTRNKPMANHHGGHSADPNPSSTSNITPRSTSLSPPGSSSGGGGIDTPDCASSATKPGNKIELLCACGRQCLNPMSDHIARCDIPCFS